MEASGYVRSVALAPCGDLHCAKELHLIQQRDDGGNQAAIGNAEWVAIRCAEFELN
jgi:hypothetical protein